VTAVEIADTAVADLDFLIQRHHLPEDSWRRVAERVKRLTTFPRMGRPLAGNWSGYRLIGGPWCWMAIIYRYDEAADLVSVVTVQDARSSVAVTTS
jgi:plasmid stabilization system protein ParE